MAINPRLELRQAHSLVMTPQLQQAIKLLQLPNLELSTFVEGELERNPLLERDETDETSSATAEAAPAAPKEDAGDTTGAGSTASEPSGEVSDSDDWVDLEASTGASQTADLDAEPQDMFPDSDSFTPGALKDSGWSGLTQGSSGGEISNLEAYVAEEKTLRDHLVEQLSLSFNDPPRRLIGQHLIDMTDEAGYLRGGLDGLAERLGAPLELIEETLAVMQGFEPCGVFARDLRECLTLQLRDLDRCDPAMAALIDNLHLLGMHDLAALKRAARVSDEDLCDMIVEVKRLNPKPGLKYGSVPTQPIVPDVLVRSLPD